MTFRPLLLVLAFTLVSCDAHYKDVSSSHEYVGETGKRFVLHEDLLIHGITTNRKYAPPPTYYLITSRPGIGGPEVLSQEVLARGTILSVARIMECSNCMPAKVRATVVVSNKSMSEPVVIDARLLREKADVVKTNKRDGGN